MSKQWILTILAVLVLSACGGGGGGSVSVGSTGSGGHSPGVSDAELKQAMRVKVDDWYGLKDYKLNIGGKTYQIGDDVDISTLPSGFSNHDYTSSGLINNQSLYHYTGTVRLYKQAYSFVVGNLKKTVRSPTGSVNVYPDFRIMDVGGFATKNQNLPAAGKFDYQGVAFDQNQTDGRLRYTVDFGKRTGSGRIDGLKDSGTIILQEASIIKDIKPGIAGIEGNADFANYGQGSYALGFFGPQAEEIAGSADFEKHEPGKASVIREAGFAGKKQ